MDLPKMLYRFGSMLEWDGEMFDYLIVSKVEELEEALGLGWSVEKPVKPKKPAK